MSVILFRDVICSWRCEISVVIHDIAVTRVLKIFVLYLQVESVWKSEISVLNFYIWKWNFNESILSSKVCMFKY